MKDELDGNILLEFVGLRAKSYAFQQLILYGNKNWDEGQILDIKKLKGIQKSIINKHGFTWTQPKRTGMNWNELESWN